jgi:hypothetical protein
MKIPGRLEPNCWVEVTVERSDGDLLNGREARAAA